MSNRKEREGRQTKMGKEEVYRKRKGKEGKVEDMRCRRKRSEEVKGKRREG